MRTPRQLSIQTATAAFPILQQKLLLTAKSHAKTLNSHLTQVSLSNSPPATDITNVRALLMVVPVILENENTFIST